MGNFSKILSVPILAFGLSAGSISITSSEMDAAKPETSNVKDLVIDLNVPQVTREVNENKLGLHALHVYKDGHFLQASQNMEWRSSNQNVAVINQDGEVTFTGCGGKTVFSVSDGSFSDKIFIQYKGDQKNKILVKKEEGKRYDVITRAIRHMSLEAKVGQMLMLDFQVWNGRNVTEMNSEIAQIVKNYHLGGVILFRENVVTPAQTMRLVDSFQQEADPFALLMAIDQEGGIVTRLQSGTDMPGNMALGAARSEILSENVGKAIGEELKVLGINMDLAPDLDVNLNPDNPVIGVRSFGADPRLTARLGKAFIKGVKESGIAATGKHFPGHGDTTVDSHLGLPEIPYHLKRLKEVELYPFQQVIAADVDAIMTAHVTFPMVDSSKAISKKDGNEIAIPATLSHKVLTGLLRQDMGFNGVIITDAMNMQAISDNFGPVNAALRAVKAGADIILMPVGIKEVANGLYDAVKGGEIPLNRIEKSVRRILTLKLKRGIIKPETEPDIEGKVTHALRVVGSKEHKNLEKEAAARSITLIKNNCILPLKLGREDKIAVVGNSAYYVDRLFTQIQKHHGNTIFIDTVHPLTAGQLDQVRETKYIILGTYTSREAGMDPGSGQMRLANQLISETGVPVIAVAIRNPYDIMSYPNAAAFLAQYGFSNVNFEASANTIFGDNKPTGKLPVTIFSPLGEVMYGFDHGLGY